MDISGSDIIVFGGYGAFPKVEDGTCEYFTILNTDSMTWDKGKYAGQAPPRRHGHTSTIIGPHLLIFGGWEATKAMNDVVVIRDLSSVANNA